jgi:integrase
MDSPLAKMALAKIKSEHLRELHATVGAKRRQSRRKAGLSPHDVERPVLARSTVLNLHAVLSGAFAQAVADHKIEHNPASSARPPRPERKRIEALSADEVEAVISAVGEHRLVDVLELCLECGLRVGEAIGLTWDRVHLDADVPWATIDRQLQCLKGTWLLDEPKRRSVRVVGLSRRACEVLRRTRDRQTFEKRAVEPAALDADQQGETSQIRWGWSWNQARRRAEPTV